MLMFGPLRGTKLATPREYARRVLLYRVFFVAWLVTLVALDSYWNTLAWQLRVFLVILLILCTPALSDAFRPYGKYEKRWMLENRDQ
jgi:hypothetical protein